MQTEKQSNTFSGWTVVVEMTALMACSLAVGVVVSVLIAMPVVLLSALTS
jgi:hypothetical protein